MEKASFLCVTGERHTHTHTNKQQDRRVSHKYSGQTWEWRRLRNSVRSYLNRKEKFSIKLLSMQNLSTRNERSNTVKHTDIKKKKKKGRLTKGITDVAPRVMS